MGTADSPENVTLFGNGLRQVGLLVNSGSESVTFKDRPAGSGLANEQRTVSSPMGGVLLFGRDIF